MTLKTKLDLTDVAQFDSIKIIILKENKCFVFFFSCYYFLIVDVFLAITKFLPFPIKRIKMYILSGRGLGQLRNLIQYKYFYINKIGKMIEQYGQNWAI